MTTHTPINHPTIKRTIDHTDIMPLDQFIMERPTLYNHIQTLKQNRRLSVGPYITLYFENHQTLLWQIQEMLRIEKGGSDQLQDELDAYAPLLPQILPNADQELIATLMIEIDDLVARKIALHQLTNIEDHVSFHVQNHIITATAEQDIERTTKDGKTSAIHFLRFAFSPPIIQSMRSGGPVTLVINHPHYTHAHTLTPAQQEALCLDFDL